MNVNASDAGFTGEEATSVCSLALKMWEEPVATVVRVSAAARRTAACMISACLHGIPRPTAAVESMIKAGRLDNLEAKAAFHDGRRGG